MQPFKKRKRYFRIVIASFRNFPFFIFCNAEGYHSKEKFKGNL